MKNRKLFNTAIVRKLQELVEEYPDLRFGQILVNCDIIKYEPSVLCDGQREDLLIIDPFNEEPKIMWERMLLNNFAFKEQYN
jgi:hypothetical protein